MAHMNRLSCLLCAVAVCAAAPAPPAAPEPPPIDAPAPPTPAKEEAEEDPFRPRKRNSLNWILSHGPKRFDVFEWVTRPDLLTLADLVSWKGERDYDLDAG